MSTSQIIIAYIVSNLVAISFFTISLKWNHLARILFAALFILAGFKNWSIAHTNPGDYLSFSKYAVGLYHDIIIGPFSNNITLIVSFIAVCQFLIGVGLL